MAFLDDLHVVASVGAPDGSPAVETLKGRSESGENSSLELVRRGHPQIAITSSMVQTAR